MAANVALYVAVAVGVVVVVYWLLTRTKKIKRRSEPYAVEIKKGVWANSASRDRLVEKPKNDVNTLYEILVHAAKFYRKSDAMGSRSLVRMHEEIKHIPDPVDKSKKIEKKWYFPQLGPYQWISFEEMLQTSIDFGRGLRSIGLKRQENFAICDDTNQKWTLSAFGCHSQSIAILTVYVNLGEEKTISALNEGEIKVFQTNSTLLGPLINIKQNVPTLSVIILTDDIPAAAKGAADKLRALGVTIYSWDDILKLGKEKGDSIAVSPPEPKDIAVIMYTSGSTGPPKGVLLSHANMVSCVAASETVVSLSPDDVYISYLPLAHVLALIIESTCIYQGVPLGYGSPRSLLDSLVRGCKGDITELRPTLFPAVPAIANRLKKAVEGKVKEMPSTLRSVFDRAFETRRQCSIEGRTFPLWTSPLFKKIKAQLGGRVRLMVSGGAPLQSDVHTFLRVCFECNVVQGYGLTETTGGSTIMQLDDISTGRCGPPLPSNFVKLISVPEMRYTLEDKPNPRGEVVIVGNTVSLGYYKNPQKTKEEYREGGFCTGDIGEIFPDGTLKIIDRRKNLIKPPHGEYVAVESLEAIYRNSRFVSNVCVYVDGDHDEIVALAQADLAEVRRFATEHNLKDMDPMHVCNTPELRSAVMEDFQNIAKKHKLKSFEFVRAVRILGEEWTPDNGLLTAAMKIDRNAIKERFWGDILAMYKEVGH